MSFLMTTIFRYTIVSLSETALSMGAESRSMAVEKVSGAVGNTNICTTIHCRFSFAIDKDALREAVKLLTFCTLCEQKYF